MRVVVYCQSLTGIGHYVRSLEIAKALARRHEIYMTAGGRSVPVPADGVRFIAMEPLRRVGGQLDADRDVDVVLAARAQALRDAIRAIRPDALLVEHFPFGKWELAAEATAAIEAARPTAKVICSVRDIGLRSRYVDTAESYDIAGSLGAHFDALLVHGDPSVTRLEDQLPTLDVPVPVHYTGYVSRKCTGGAPPAEASGAWIVSAGGGVEAEEVIGPCLAARRLLGGGPMVAVTGPCVLDKTFDALASRCAVEGVALHRFTSDLVEWMGAAALSVSRAGYNTCTNILESRVPAVLLPSPRMVDQGYRARLLAERGLVESLDVATPELIAASIERALARPRLHHAIDLDGAARTFALVEEIVAR